jgi:hypothetical protein
MGRPPTGVQAGRRQAAGDQPQQPPPQHPPPAGPPEGPSEEEPAPTETVDSSLTVSSWPRGQGGAGASDWDMGRRISKVDPHALQRYS